jgi:uracil-DNA glycosylase
VIPHPSPLNVKWFKDYPDFEKERVKDIRKAVHDAIDGAKG